MVIRHNEEYKTLMKKAFATYINYMNTGKIDKKLKAIKSILDKINYFKNVQGGINKVQSTIDILKESKQLVYRIIRVYYIFKYYLPSDETSEVSNSSLVNLNIHDIEPLRAALISNTTDRCQEDKLLTFEEYNSVMSNMINISMKSSRQLTNMTEAIFNILNNNKSESVLSINIITQLVIELIKFKSKSFTSVESDIYENLIKNTITDNRINALKESDYATNKTALSYMGTIFNLLNFSDNYKSNLKSIGENIVRPYVDFIKERASVIEGLRRDIMNIINRDLIGGDPNMANLNKFIERFFPEKSLENKMTKEIFSDINSSSGKMLDNTSAMKIIKSVRSLTTGQISYDMFKDNMKEIVKFSVDSIMGDNFWSKIYTKYNKIKLLNNKYHVFDYFENTANIAKALSNLTSSKTDEIIHKFWLYFSNRCAQKGTTNNFELNNSDIDVCLGQLSLNKDVIYNVLSNLKKVKDHNELLKDFDAELQKQLTMLRILF